MSSEDENCYRSDADIDGSENSDGIGHQGIDRDEAASPTTVSLLHRYILVLETQLKNEKNSDAGSIDEPYQPRSLYPPPIRMWCPHAHLSRFDPSYNGMADALREVAELLSEIRDVLAHHPDGYL